MAYFERLKKCRERAGLSINRLAELSGVDRGTITRAERSEDVRADRLHPLLDVLNREYFQKNGTPLDPAIEITDIPGSRSK